MPLPHLPQNPKALALSVAAGLTLAAVAAPLAEAQYPSLDRPPSSHSHRSPKIGGGPVSIAGTSPANYHFSPKTTKVKRGAKVTWSWHSNAPHNVTFPSLHKASPTRTATTAFALRFKRPGTYRYLCTIHDFSGTVVVR